MTEDKLSRRTMLRHGVQWPAAGVALWALSACGEGKPKVVACADPNSLSFAENSLRKSGNYAETAPDPAKICSGCSFFSSEDPTAKCGKCEIFQGPVNPKGHCDSWAARQA